MPAASPSEGRSPNWIHAAATPITGVASVAIPAAPAESRRSPNSQSSHASALPRMTLYASAAVNVGVQSGLPCQVSAR